MKKLILFASLSVCLCASAETLRWPMRIVETTYTVHTLTGATSNEKSKEKTSVVAVDITKSKVDGADVLNFVQRYTKSMVETASETAKESIPFDKKEELLAAVLKVKSEMSKVSNTGDSSESVFDSDGLKLTQMCEKRKKYLFVEFEDKSAFELEPVHTQQFIDLLKRMK